MSPQPRAEARNENLAVDRHRRCGAAFDETKIQNDSDYLIYSFLASRGIVKQHIHSFNYLINHGMRNIIMANSLVTSEVDPNFYLKYLDIRVEKPTVDENYTSLKAITPNECRLRDITYSANIVVDVEYTRGHQRIVRNNLTIGRMPIMLRSSHCILTGKSNEELVKLNECPHDTGGYFVVKGTEKVILIQEQMTKNRILVNEDTNKGLICYINGSSDERKSKTTLFRKQEVLMINLNVFQEDIHVCVIFKALGITTDLEILKMVGFDESIVDKFLPSIQQGLKINVHSQNQALDYIQSRLKIGKIAMDVLNEDFLSNIKSDNWYFKDKAMFLGLMIQRLLLAESDSRYIDDRDHYGNKRLELSGQMLSLIFEDSIKKLNSDIITIANKYLPKPKADQFDVVRHIRPDSISREFVHALSTGNWVIKRFKVNKAGVAQVLTRLSYISAVSNMTKIASQFEKSRKVSGPRSLLSSHWGMICPSDTPEGESCGLIKNLALLAHITIDTNPDNIVRLCLNIGVVPANLLDSTQSFHSSESYLVTLNGSIVGMCFNGEDFIKSLKLLRRTGNLDPFLNIYCREFDRTIHLSCDGGRLCRPYLIVENGEVLINTSHYEQLRRQEIEFDDLIKLGIIEFMDVNEQNNAYIALVPSDIVPGKTTHLEIDQMTILGVCVALVPFPHHNQSPRNTYQCAMGKQAMGTIGFNQLNRIDTLMNLLVYPQKPLVKSKTLDIINFDELPAGQNATIAVLSSTCFDIEDAILLNRASLDRGLGRCIVYGKKSVSLKKYANQTYDIIRGPLLDPVTMKNIWTHEALDVDGICRPGSIIQNHQLLVNKCVPVVDDASKSDQSGNSFPKFNQANQVLFKETPLKYNNIEPSTVESVMLTCNSEDHFLMKLKMRQVRRPEIGDKFSSRHGQKGVCGLIVDQEDMPFSESGICPDIIMNPHGYPSRMTVGKLIELLGSKAGALKGKTHYGTAFGGSKVCDIERELKDCGFNCKGKDILYSGVTGKPMEAYVYQGPVYYQKLKHMVVDKIHARARGPRAVITRQPTAGRARDGGMRFGEMEKDCLVAYGVSNLILERLMISSDIFTTHICKKCGYFSTKTMCNMCGSGQEIAAINMPYACKLLMQELFAMNIMPRMHLTDFNSRDS